MATAHARATVGGGPHRGPLPQRGARPPSGSAVGVLIRDVPDDVIAALETHARRLGLSRTEYVRRRLAQDAAHSGSPVSTGTAELAGLVVLHCDKDFDRIASLTGQAAEWLKTS